MEKQKKVTQLTLKNGLKVSHIHTDCNLFKIQVIVRAGMLQELENQIGFAHLIEHVMSFFPSNKYPDSELNQQMLTNFGVNTNAWTEENTCGYFVEGIPKFFFNCIDLIFQNYVDPILDSRIFEQEKAAVLQELNTITEDIWYNLQHMIQSCEYRNTILQKSVYDEIDNVKSNAKLENILQFRKSFYHPGITNVLITSNHTKTEFKKLCNDIYDLYFDGFKYKKITSVPMTIISDGKHAHDNDIFHYVKPQIETESYTLNIRFPIPFDYFDTRTLMLDDIEAILTGGMGSRLYYALRTKLGAIYNVSSFSHLDPRNKKYNRYVIEVETSNPVDVFDYIMIELNELIVNFSFTKHENEQIANTLDNSEMYNKCYQSFSKHTTLYEDEIIWNKKLMSFEDMMKIKRSFTDRQFKKLLGDIFVVKNMKVYYSGPEPVFKNATGSGDRSHFIYKDSQS